MFIRYSSFWHGFRSLEQKMRSFFSQHWHKIYSLEILVNDQKSRKKVPPEMTKKTNKIIAEKLFLQLWNPFYGSCFHVKMEERETTSERRRGAWMKIGALHSFSMHFSDPWLLWTCRKQYSRRKLPQPNCQRWATWHRLEHTQLFMKWEVSLSQK